MMPYALLFMLLLLGCGGAGAPAMKPAAQLYKDCTTWCYHRMSCYQQVCEEDYGGNKAFEASVLANQCVATYCDSGDYAKDQSTQKAYFDCTMTKSCREITTGTCGDVATCTADPSSTPYLPGTRTKASPEPAKLILTL